MRIGVISDTHGLFRPQILPLLKGCDHILHLGDVGDMEILNFLTRTAPISAIRGNVDTHGPCARLPETEVIPLGSKDFYMLHNLQDLDLDPVAAGFAAVLYGHSHKPLIEWKRGGLYLNPGSCGPRRFSLPVTIAQITISDAGELTAEILPVAIPD